MRIHMCTHAFPPIRMESPPFFKEPLWQKATSQQTWQAYNRKGERNGSGIPPLEYVFIGGSVGVHIRTKVSKHTLHWRGNHQWPIILFKKIYVQKVHFVELRKQKSNIPILHLSKVAIFGLKVSFSPLHLQSCNLGNCLPPSRANLQAAMYTFLSAFAWLWGQTRGEGGGGGRATKRWIWISVWDFLLMWESRVCVWASKDKETWRRARW